jgi:hypothetical protein
MSFNFKMKDTVEDTEVEDLDNAPEDYKLTGRIY